MQLLSRGRSAAGARLLGVGWGAVPVIFGGGVLD